MWAQNQNCDLQSYFNYVSFLERCWHETYHPTYHYYPKKLVPNDLLNSAVISKSQNASVDVIIDGPHLNKLFLHQEREVTINDNLNATPGTVGTIVGSSLGTSKRRNIQPFYTKPLQFSFELTNGALQYAKLNRKSKRPKVKESVNSFRRDLEILSNGAEDIEDVNKYLNLCSSTYGKNADQKSENTTPISSHNNKQNTQNYKDFTMRFSLNSRATSISSRANTAHVSKRNTRQATLKHQCLSGPKQTEIGSSNIIAPVINKVGINSCTMIDESPSAHQNSNSLPRGINNFNFEIKKSPFNFGKAAVEDIINHS